MREIVLGVLATWGLSALLFYWKGLEALHRWAKTDVVDEQGRSVTWIGRQLQCFWCIAVWASVPVSVLARFVPVALYPLAFAGGAMLLSKGGRIVWAVMQE